ncbi:uracil-DNA glycosylase [soil metagenome]
MANINTQNKLDSLAKKIIADKVCPELAEQATQQVFGDGNTDAEIVFIGEAPGKNEDLQGKPFIGAAGKFLDEMLDSIGLKRQDVYITNIVKYRPPGNRDPLPEEKAAFLPYLQTQLEIIQPKLVVTLGRHSMNCFLPDLQISKIHGQPKRIKLRFGSHQSNAIRNTQENRRQETGDGELSSKQRAQTLVVMPLFHPAAALYNGAMRQTLLEDFAKIPEVLKIIETKQQ